jgi:hypothetical protein
MGCPQRGTKSALGVRLCGCGVKCRALRGTARYSTWARAGNGALPHWRSGSSFRWRMQAVDLGAEKGEWRLKTQREKGGAYGP